MSRSRIMLTARARAEARDAFAWYAGQNPLAGELFQVDLRAALRMVAEAPERWTMWRTPFRRLLFERFPYQLVYRRIDEARVVVVAVRHQRRDPEDPLIE